MRYEFTNKYNGSYFIREKDTIVLDLKKYGNNLTEKERDYMISEILTHEHLHRVIYQEFGEYTDRLLDFVYHKYFKRENDRFERIARRNGKSISFWSDAFKDKELVMEFNEIRKEASREHGNGLK